MTKFEVPKEISDRVYQALEVAKNTGKIRKGSNEVTKAIERGLAKLVVIAGDVLCEEKKCDYVYVPSKEELGRSAGINVPTAAVCIVEAGEAKGTIEDLVKKIAEFKK